ncbi:MAG: hypothetical protein A2Z74_06285 [Chloroflexi bacterium RBG_13_46_9]|nr:MAG: hypothetical protein A2Z74_06285 [Chloroflexi bacterium RBG_13_46_9]
MDAISSGRQGRLMRKKLRALHQAAQASISIKPDAKAVAMEVSLFVSRYCLVEQQVERFVKALIRLVDSTEEGKYLLSIPGINYISAAAWYLAP